MTDEEIRVAIAKHLGWRFAGDTEFDEYTKCWRNASEWCAPPETDFTKWRPEHPLVNRPHLVPTHGVPRYTECLNAMHEAEKVLSPEQWLSYWSFLGVKLQDLSILHATARQRAEAFLRTLSLWKD